MLLEGSLYWWKEIRTPKQFHLRNSSWPGTDKRKPTARATIVRTMGDGAEQNLKKAVELYWVAAEQGNPCAQYNLGHMRQMGTCDVECDFAEAVP
jgi:TPR repeat protein